MDKTSKTVEAHLSERITLEIEKIKKESIELKEKQKAFESEINKSKTDSISFTISVLSIFTALAFILFSGVSGLSGIPELIDKDSFPFALLYLGVFALIILGAICLFVYFILEIINRFVDNERHFGFEKFSLRIIISICILLVLLYVVWCLIGKNKVNITLLNRY